MTRPVSASQLLPRDCAYLVVAVEVEGDAGTGHGDVAQVLTQTHTKRRGQGPISASPPDDLGTRSLHM